MKIGILTDSGCDLEQELITNYEVNVMPLLIEFAAQDYIAGIEIKKDNIANRMQAKEEMPAVNSPSVKSFKEKYKELAVKYDYLISLHTAQELSSAVSKARTAAKSIDNLDIKVVDSGTTSLGLGLLVCLAGKLSKEGVEFEELIEIIKAARSKLTVYLVVEQLNCVPQSHFACKLKSWLLNKMEITSILEWNTDNKCLEIKSYIWGQEKTEVKLVELIKQNLIAEDKGWIGLAYGNKQEKLAQIKQLFISSIEDEAVDYFLFNNQIGAPLLTKVGPEVYGGAILTGDFL